MAALEQQRADLAAEAARPQVSPEEQRRLLMAQIKADNEAAEGAQARAKDAAEAIRRLEQQLQGSSPSAARSAPGAVACFKAVDQ